MLLSRLFERIVTIGRLRVIDAGGSVHIFEGSGAPRVTIRLHDPALHWKLAVRPRLYFGEAYMDGMLTVEEGSLYDLIDLFAVNLEAMPAGLLARLLNRSVPLFRRIHQYNPLPRHRQHVAHQSDLSAQL